MNRSRYLEQLIDAGVSSFKIEGRLKDTGYVKNVTAYYRLCIDEILARRSEYCRASAGTVQADFRPNPAKSFNRGFTDYFLTGRNGDMASINTPKSVGEPVGMVKEIHRGSFTVDSNVAFSNGDGLCFFDGSGTLHGFRINKAEGKRLFPLSMPEGLQRRTRLFRNSDAAFERLLSKPTAERRVALDMELSETPGGYALALSDELGRKTVHAFDYPHEEARTPQGENLRKQLLRLGDTLFHVRSIELHLAGERFIPSSVLAAARRDAVAAHMRVAAAPVREKRRTPKAVSFAGREIDSSYNVANSKARNFYMANGAGHVSPAYELEPRRDMPLMTCRYCIRHALGACAKEGNARVLPGKLFLRLGDGRRFRLDFDCNKCNMKVYADE